MELRLFINSTALNGHINPLSYYRMAGLYSLAYFLIFRRIIENKCLREATIKYRQQ
jgi:hypothetical protein